MEDALAARNRAEELNLELQRENAERARVQAALQASESQMRLVTDNLPVFIAYCDAGERFRFVNQPYAEYFGLRVEEVVDKRIEEVVGAAAYANFHQYVEVALAGRTVEFEQAVPHGQTKREMRCAYIPDLGAKNSRLFWIDPGRDGAETRRGTAGDTRSDRDVFERCDYFLHCSGTHSDLESRRGAAARLERGGRGRKTEGIFCPG